MPAKIKAVAFDLDNTLIHRDAAARSVFEIWLGVEHVPSEIIARDAGGLAPRRAFFRWLEGQFPHLGSDLWPRFQHDITAHIKPDAPTLELLAQLKRQGTQIAILTNGGERLQRRKISAASLDTIVPPELILISAEIGIEKPDPGAFAALASALGHPPSQALFVGDQAEIDIGGAKAGGFQTCQIGFGPRSPDADFMIDQLADLRSILL